MKQTYKQRIIELTEAWLSGDVRAGDKLSTLLTSTGYRKGFDFWWCAI